MYTPTPETLQKYADVLVNFALGKGKGVQKGEVVQVVVPECAKPMYEPLRQSILAAGGHAMMFFTPDDVGAARMFEQMTDEQLDFLPTAYYKGLVAAVDHSIMILAEFDKYELKDVAPEKLMRRQKAMKPYREWREAKENEGRFSWTLALYGTEAMARDVGMSLEDYWEQIINACYLNEADPISHWKQTADEIERVRRSLNELKIQKVHVEGPDVDLHIGLGDDRQWLGGSGANIPSFELFISPDTRQTEGTIWFNQPLYTHGSRISGIALEFTKGRIVKASATENEALLKEMIATEGADQIGEFSLTDGRLSRITKPMGETLYDENMGGSEGNTHIAIGSAYKDSYPGDQSKVTKQEWEAMGYNESVVHTDIISTSPRTVTATLKDGSTKVIYERGQFTI